VATRRRIIIWDWYFDEERELDFAARELALPNFKNAPALAIAYPLAGALMEICDPLFWMAVILPFLFSELSPSLITSWAGWRFG
jgi:hypothetical protein